MLLRTGNTLHAAKPGEKKVYTGRRVSLEFSDADIRKILQLIAEVSNLNFLIGDDVTGTLSIKLVNVPWDQALEVILETKGLEKRQEGNIMYIKPNDVNLAEPNALIGFSGARVSAGTIAEELPPGFQRAEFLLSHGFVDRIVTRAELRDELASIFSLLARPRRAAERGRHRQMVEQMPHAGPRRTPAGAPEPAAPRRRLDPRPARPQPAPPAHPRARRPCRRHVRRAPRRPPLRRGRVDRRRARPDRRPARRHRRQPEGRRHRREHPPQLRDEQAGGAPQGDPLLRARGAVRHPGRHLRRHAGRLPGRRGGGARDRRGDRRIDHGDDAACASRS